MKKLFTSLLMLCFVGLTVQAQTEYINETFDADIPSTWTTTSEGDEFPWFWDDGTNYFQTIDSTGYARVDSDADGNGFHMIELLEAPEFDASAGNIIIVQFDHYYNHIGADSAAVEVWDGTEWHTAWSAQEDIGGWLNAWNGDPVAQTIIITDYINTSGNTKVRFRYDDGDVWAWYWAIDNVVISSVDCLEPQNITIEQGAIAANITWDSGSGLSDMIWDTTGFDPMAEGTLIEGITSPYNLTGLDPESTYDFYLRDDCDANGLSAWAGPFTFTTTVACPDVYVPWNPFLNPTSTSMDIDGFYPEGLGDVYIIVDTTGFILGETGDTIGPVTAPYTIDGLSPLGFYDVYWFMDCTGDALGYSNTSGVKSFNTLTDAAGTSCADPVILNNNLPYVVDGQSICGYGDNVTAYPTNCNQYLWNQEEIVFAYAPETDDQILGIYGSNFETGSSVYFSVMDACPDSADAGCVASGYFDFWGSETTFLLDDAELVNGNTYYVMISGSTNNGCTFDLNIFVIDCSTPSLLNYTPTQDSTILTWVSDSEAPNWQVEWGVEGFEPGTGTFIDGEYGVDGPPISVTGLSDTVNYQFYVTDICGFGNQSIPAGPSLFTGPPPLNDLCVDATTLECGDIVAGNVSSATDSISAGIQTCSEWTYLDAPAVWYTFEGTGNEVVLSTCGTEFAHRLWLYTGDCTDSLYCQDYSTGNYYQGEYQCPSGNWDGQYMSIQTELGVTYTVALSGNWGESGTFDLAMECIPCSAPFNLDVDTYSDTEVQFSWESFNEGATYSYDVVLCGEAMGTGTSGTGTVDSAMPTQIVSELLPLTCYDVYVYETCTDSGTDTLMTSFTTNEFAPPVNDQCSGALPLACGETDTSSTVYSTTFGNPGPDFYCDDEWDIMDAKNVWFSFVGTGQEMNVSTCGSNINGGSYYTDLMIFSGTCEEFECVGQSSYNSEPGCSIFGSTQYSFYGELGVTYYASVSGTWSGATGGEVVVSLDCIPCSTPMNITSNQTDASAYISWESFNQPTTYTLVWDTAGFDFPTEPGNVITGSTDDIPVLIEGLDSASTYDVYIFEYCESITANSDTVEYSFTTNDSPPPANDEPCNAVALIAGDTLVTSNSWATSSPGEPVPEAGSCNDPDQMQWCNDNITTSTWYTFTPEMSGWATISTCHANSYDTQMAAYTASDCNDWTTYELVAANDDMGDCSVATNFTSAVSLCLEGGVTYYIQVDPYSTPSTWNPNPGQEFSISVEFAGANIDNNLEFVNGPHTATINWGYNSTSGDDVDFMLIIEDLGTGDMDTVMGNTADLPLFLEGLADDTEFSYTIYSDDACTTTSGPHTFMTPVDGINELNFGENVNVYPNPVSDMLTIEINGKVDAGSVISIVNLQGKAIFVETVTENVSNYRSEIDVNNFARGVYILKLEDENSSIQERIIVQ